MEIIEWKFYNHARTTAKNATIGHWHAGPAIESTTLGSRCSALTNRATKSSCRALIPSSLPPPQAIQPVMSMPIRRLKFEI